jgi:mRNA interferase MazF
MARPVNGDVVVVPFPFSDLTQAKRRPALVLAELGDDDLILSQITSRTASDSYAVSLTDEDFAQAAFDLRTTSDPTGCSRPTMPSFYTVSAPSSRRSSPRS